MSTLARGSRWHCATANEVRNGLGPIVGGVAGCRVTGELGPGEVGHVAPWSIDNYFLFWSLGGSSAWGHHQYMVENLVSTFTI